MERNFLQGDLQRVFDAIYSIGAVDPVLKIDWKPLQEKLENNPEILSKLVKQVNSCPSSTDIVELLKTVDTQTLQILTMEVAREFAEFADRSTLH